MSLTCLLLMAFNIYSTLLSWASPVNARSAKVIKIDMMPTELRLGDPCRSSYECLHHLHHSHCDWDRRVCTCQPYHYAFNNTFCLPASLLGYGCAVDEQCQIKVKDSQCSSKGLCRCKPNRIPYRKDKCLPPAIIGDFCLNDGQCHLSSAHSYCKYIIPRVYGKCQCPLGYFMSVQSQCLPHLGSPCQNNEECRLVTEHSHCQTLGRYSECHCDLGYKTSRNGIRCEKDILLLQDESATQQKSGLAVSLGKPCITSIQCQSRDSNSECINGRCECVASSPRCSSHRTGCANDTFQCTNGQCISWYFVCDGERNCGDGSDEELCVAFSCPAEAFQCNDGTCMSRSVVCNGRWECPDGSDEARCYKGIPCDKNSFRCANGQCLPQYSFCNAVVDCFDGSDETYDTCERGVECPATSFRCGNGRCRSTAILCSGLDGCGDNSDESRCEVCYCEKP